jgi:hypothetical protein
MCLRTRTSTESLGTHLETRLIQTSGYCRAKPHRDDGDAEDTEPASQKMAHTSQILSKIDTEPVDLDTRRSTYQ